MTQPWEKNKQKSSLILTVQPTKATPNHRDNENNEGQLMLAYQETSQQQGKKEKLLLAYRETSQQQKEKLLLTYQETSQQQEEKKNYCSPTKRQVSSKKKKKNYCSPTKRRVSRGKSKLLLAYLETSQQLATSKRDRKKRAAHVQKSRVVDVCVKQLVKNLIAELQDPVPEHRSSTKQV